MFPQLHLHHQSFFGFCILQNQNIAHRKHYKFAVVCFLFPGAAILFLPKSHGVFSKFPLGEEAANKAAAVEHLSKWCIYCAWIRMSQKALISPACSLTCQVFKPRTPPEAIALCSRLLEYTPVTRLSPLEACAHAFFDELRQPNTRLPSGRELPLLFNFSPVGQFSSFPASRL